MLSKENYYTEAYMAMGMCLGLLLGSMGGLFNAFTDLLAINLISISLPLGMIIGMAGGLVLGSRMDEKVKAEGKMI